MINADKYILVNREQYSSFLLGLQSVLWVAGD